MDDPFGTNAGTPTAAGDGAFERFLTAAIAAIITIMFSWRLLATEENLGGGEGATGGAVGGSDKPVPKAVIKEAIKMAKAAGYTEESRALEEAKGFSDTGKHDNENSGGSGVKHVTSSDLDTESLITCWEASRESAPLSCETDPKEGFIMDPDLNLGVNGMSRGVAEYGYVSEHEHYQTFSSDAAFGDNVEPRELDSDEEMYCATMLETIMEEDSDDMCSNSTGSDVDHPAGRPWDFGYADDSDAIVYTDDGGCTVHVMDDGSELGAHVISVSKSANISSPRNSELDKQADDSDDERRDRPPISLDLADDSNSDGSDESVITVVTRQLSEEKESPVSKREFSYPTSEQIEIVPVWTRSQDQSLAVHPITVQSTFQALQPDEHYPTQGSPVRVSNTFDTSPSLDSGVYSIEKKNDAERSDKSPVAYDGTDKKFDINSNKTEGLEPKTVGTLTYSDSASTGGADSPQRVDIVFDESENVPDYKDAYVSSAVEKTPKGFIFSRFELETTDYEEKFYTTDRSTHTVVAKLVAQEKFVPSDKTDDETREKFGHLEYGDKVKTSPEIFNKAATSKETNVDDIFADEHGLSGNEHIILTKRVQSGEVTPEPPEKLLRMDRTDGSKSHRIVPFKKDISDKPPNADQTSPKDLYSGDPGSLSKRISEVSVGESPPEKVLKVTSEGETSTSLQISPQKVLEVKSVGSHETGRKEENKTQESRAIISLKRPTVERKSRGVSIDDILSRRSRENLTEDTPHTSRETLIGDVTSSRTLREAVSDDIPSSRQSRETLIGAVGSSRTSRETLIDDKSSPRQSRETLIDDIPTSRQLRETLIDDIPSSRQSRETLIDDIPYSRQLRETLIDDIPSSRQSRETLIDDIPYSRQPRETLIDDIPSSRKSRETLIDDIPTSRKSRETLIDDKPFPQPSRETLIDDVPFSRQSRETHIDVIPSSQQPWGTLIDDIRSSRHTRETLIDDVPWSGQSSETVIGKVPSKTQSHDSRSSKKTFDDVSLAHKSKSIVVMKGNELTSLETAIDDDTIAKGRMRITGSTPVTGVYETNIDQISARLSKSTDENVKRFRDRASLNRDGSNDDSNGNELDKSFGDVTNRSEEILDNNKREGKDDSEEEWTVDEVVQEFTIVTDTEGHKSFIPGKSEHRIIQSPVGSTSDLFELHHIHMRDKSPEQEGPPIPKPRPRQSLKSEDNVFVDPRKSPKVSERSDDKLHLDAIDEVSWKPLSDSFHAEKTSPTVRKYVMDDVIISGSHLTQQPRKQFFSEADKSNPQVSLDMGNLGSYGTRANLAQISTDFEEDGEIDFDTFSGGVAIPSPKGPKEVSRPLSESSPKFELPAGADGHESPDESNFPSPRVRRKILEEFKRSKSVEHLRHAVAQEEVERLSPLKIPQADAETPPVTSIPVIPDSPVVSPPKAFLVSKKGSKSVPNLSGIDESESAGTPITHTANTQQMIVPTSPQLKMTGPPVSAMSKRPSRYAKRSSSTSSSSTVQASPVIKAATKAKSFDSQPNSRQVVQTDIDDVLDAPEREFSPVIPSKQLKSPPVVSGTILMAPSQTLKRPVAQTSNKKETTFGSDMTASSPTVAVSPTVKLPGATEPKYASKSTSEMPVVTSPTIKASPAVKYPGDKPTTVSSPNTAGSAMSIATSPTIAVSPTLKYTADRKPTVTPETISESAMSVATVAGKSESLHKETSFGTEVAVVAVPTSPVVKRMPEAHNVSQSNVKGTSPVVIDSPVVKLPGKGSQGDNKHSVAPDEKLSDVSVGYTREIETSSIVLSPSIKAPVETQQFSYEAPDISMSSKMQMPSTVKSSSVSSSPVISDAPLISPPPEILSSPEIPVSPNVSLPTSSLDDSSLEDAFYKGQKKYKSLKEIKKKFGPKSFKSLQMPPTPNIGQFVVPPRAVLNARRKINASRKRFLSEENLTSDNRWNEQFNEHKDAVVNTTTKYKSPRRPGQRQPSSYSSQELLYPDFFLDESIDYRPNIDELHKNCILTPEGRKDIFNKTMSIENLTLDLGAHLKRFGSVTSLVETDIDTGETSETQPFPETDLDLWFSLQQPIERAVSMSDLHTESSHRTGKGRFASRNVPKSKSLQTLETNLDDEEEELKRTPSVHELRITKSLSKLNIPDWFKTSSLSKSSSCLLRHGSTSTMSSWGFNPSLTSSPCPSVTPSGNVVIKTHVSPSSSMRFLRSPRFASVPTLPKTPEERTVPRVPVKLPSDKFRKEEKPKSLEKIPIVPFAKIRAMFESKAANERADKKLAESRQGSVSSKVSEMSPVTVPVVTVSPSDTSSEIVQLEGSPKRPRSPPVKPPDTSNTRVPPVPQKRTFGPLQNASTPKRPDRPSTLGKSSEQHVEPTAFSIPYGGTVQRPMSPEAPVSQTYIHPDSYSPQRTVPPSGPSILRKPMSPTDSSSPRSVSPLGSLNSSDEVARSFYPTDKMRPINADGLHNRSLSPTGFEQPPSSRQPVSPVEYSSPRSFSPLGSLNSSDEGSRSFSSSDKMRPINPDGPHNRSLSPTGFGGLPRSLSPAGTLRPRGEVTTNGETTTDVPSREESQPVSARSKGPRGILGPTVSFTETESLEIKDNKPPQKSPGKKTDFFKRLQMFQRSPTDKDKKGKTEDSKKSKQVPVPKLKSTFEPSSQNDTSNGRSIETAPTVTAPASKPAPKYSKSSELRPVEEAPVVQAPNSRHLESAPTIRPSQDFIMDSSYRALADPSSRVAYSNHDRNSHTAAAEEQDYNASPVRVGNSGQSLPTPVLTASPFSRTSPSQPPKPNVKGEKQQYNGDESRNSFEEQEDPGSLPTATPHSAQPPSTPCHGDLDDVTGPRESNNNIASFEDVLDGFLSFGKRHGRGPPVSNSAPFGSNGEAALLANEPPAETSVNSLSENTSCFNPACSAPIDLRANTKYKMCAYCYTYYCGSLCRKVDMFSHKTKCHYWKVNSACRRVVLLLNKNARCLYLLSRAAWQGHVTHGRGCVLLDLPDLYSAERLEYDPQRTKINPLYVRRSYLCSQNVSVRMLPGVLDMCDSYNPETHLTLILSVGAGSALEILPPPRIKQTVIQKCAKLRLSVVLDLPKDVPKGDRNLLFLSMSRDSPKKFRDDREARETTFMDVQRKLHGRGINLRIQFPEIYHKLINFVADGIPFAPEVLYPVTSPGSDSLVCIIISEPEVEVEWLKAAELFPDRTTSVDENCSALPSSPLSLQDLKY